MLFFSEGFDLMQINLHVSQWPKIFCLKKLQKKKKKVTRSLHFVEIYFRMVLYLMKLQLVASFASWNHTVDL